MMPETCRRVIGGVDTHKDQNVAVAIDETGQGLGGGSFETNTSGYASMLEWFTSFGELGFVGSPNQPAGARSTTRNPEGSRGHQCSPASSSATTLTDKPARVADSH